MPTHGMDFDPANIRLELNGEDVGTLEEWTIPAAEVNIQGDELPFAEDPPVRAPDYEYPCGEIEEPVVVDPEDEYHSIMNLHEATNIYVRGLTYYEIKCSLMGYIHEADVLRIDTSKMQAGDMLIVLDTECILLGYNGEVIRIPKTAYYADVCYMSMSDGWNEGLRRPLSATIEVNANDVCVVCRPDDGNVGTSVPFVAMDQAFDDVYT